MSGAGTPAVAGPPANRSMAGVAASRSRSRNRPAPFIEAGDEKTVNSGRGCGDGRPWQLQPCLRRGYSRLIQCGAGFRRRHRGDVGLGKRQAKASIPDARGSASLGTAVSSGGPRRPPPTDDQVPRRFPGRGGRRGRSSIHKRTRDAMFGDELSCQSPADADVAEVVDHGAEDVPALRTGEEGMALRANIEGRYRTARTACPTSTISRKPAVPAPFDHRTLLPRCPSCQASIACWMRPATCSTSARPRR